MNLTATDADAKDTENSMIGYSIKDQEPKFPLARMFTISSKSGLISVLQAGLDREVSLHFTAEFVGENINSYLKHPFCFTLV